ncbi:hypothetical protein BC831DRAFT_25415 [Entophlyctis helioformis]|nr:hypothetical protein BC831DRAFT_25415 [Entophlyctis helioformis]
MWHTGSGRTTLGRLASGQAATPTTARATTATTGGVRTSFIPSKPHRGRRCRRLPCPCLSPCLVSRLYGRRRPCSSLLPTASVVCRKRDKLRDTHCRRSFGRPRRRRSIVLRCRPCRLSICRRRCKPTDAWSTKQQPQRARCIDWPLVTTHGLSSLGSPTRSRCHAGVPRRHLPRHRTIGQRQGNDNRPVTPRRHACPLPLDQVNRDLASTQRRRIVTPSSRIRG